MECALNTIKQIKNKKKYKCEVEKWIKFGTQNIHLFNKFLRKRRDLTV